MPSNDPLPDPIDDEVRFDSGVDRNEEIIVAQLERMHALPSPPPRLTALDVPPGSALLTDGAGRQRVWAMQNFPPEIRVPVLTDSCGALWQRAADEAPHRMVSTTIARFRRAAVVGAVGVYVFDGYQ